MKKIYYLLVLFVSTFIFAQDGNVDPNFNPTAPFNNTINMTTIAVDASDNLYVGGYNSGIGYAKRILPNGSYDSTFDLTFNNVVERIFVQNDGNILIHNRSK